MSFLLVILGIGLLYLGGEMLVKQASHLALSLGISSLVIGLTIVAFGTSSPELVSTLLSVLQGVPEIAWGNIIGSNIANLGLVLGIAAVIYPLQTQIQFIQREVIFMIAVGIVLLPLLQDAELGRWDGALLLGLLGAYLFFLLKSDDPAIAEPDLPDLPDLTEPRTRAFARWRPLGGLLLSVLFLVGGAEALIRGAVGLAQSLGIPQQVIALSIVAVGTSLPELASTLVAATKRESDLILGNLIGSNIFNILGILGLTALIHPIPVEWATIQLDIAVMIGVSLLVLPFLITGLRLGRGEGIVLVGLYGVYILYIYFA